MIGSLIAIWLNLSLRMIGLIMGFGAGVLISAVAFDLIEEAADKSSGSDGVAAWACSSVAGFLRRGLADLRLGGGDRKDA